jgi:hypothetical protein
VTKTLKKDLKNNFEHPLTSKAPLHGKHFHLMHPIRGKKKKVNPNETPKTLMLFDEQQNWCEEKN